VGLARFIGVWSLALLVGAAAAQAQGKDPGAVAGPFERQGNVVTIRAAQAVVRLEFCTDTMVRVRTTFAGEFAADEPIMVVKYDWPAVRLSARDAGDAFLFATGRLGVRVAKQPVRVSFHDPTFTRPIAGELPGPGGGVVRDEAGVRLRLRLAPADQFFGLGERMDQFGWRGRTVTLNVGRGQHPDHNLGAYRIDAANYCPVPLVISTGGYGIFVHTDRATTWDVGASSAQWYEVSTDAPEMDWYFLFGPAPKQILAQYTELTGRTPLLPRPAYGINFGTYSGGTWGHEDQAGQEYVVALARRFRAEGIPADVLHLDSTWRRFGKLGGRNATSFEWRQPNFADPAAMFRTLRELHFSLVGLHVRPRLDNGEDTSLLDEALAAGIIADTPTRNVVNFFDAKAVEWWWQKAVLPKVEQGAGFLKTDEGSVFPTPGLHNLFPIVYARAAYESFQKHIGRRGFNLTREGYAGIQRYPYIWAGDWPSRWTFFPAVLRGGLNMALSGVSAWSHNAGGFEEVATEELYQRWTAFGFFTPVAHFLGMEHPQYKEPWNYGERALATFRKYARLRYRLMPYIYSAAHQAYADGTPMMRPLVLEYPDDARLHVVDDEYLFGESLLVAPVTQEGATSRRVVLPPGEWIDYWTGRRFSGRDAIEYDAPVDVLPLLARAGAILPMQPEMAYIGEKPVDPLTLEVFPAGRSSIDLYEDDGQSLEYQHGVFAITRIVCDEGNRRTTVRVEPPRGSFAVQPRAFEFSVHVDRVPRAVTVNGRPAREVAPSGRAPADGGAVWAYDAARRVVWAWTDPAGKALAAVVTIEK